jgi:hypothetical protein
MKRIIILMLLYFISANVVNSQNDKWIEVSKVGKIDLNTYNQTIEIANQPFIGGYSKSGSVWIRKLSSQSGKYYKQYLGTPLDETYDGHVIWTTKKRDKYWYFLYVEPQNDNDEPTLNRIYLQKNN